MIMGQTQVPRRLIAILVDLLGGEVVVSEEDMDRVPDTAIMAFDRPQGVAGRQFRIRVSGVSEGLDLARPSPPAPPPAPVPPAEMPVDLDVKGFPPTFRTCPECKFSFELVHGDECPVCRLQELECGSPAERSALIEAEHKLTTMTAERNGLLQKGIEQENRIASLKRSFQAEKDTRTALEARITSGINQLALVMTERDHLKKELDALTRGKAKENPQEGVADLMKRALKNRAPIKPPPKAPQGPTEFDISEDIAF